MMKGRLELVTLALGLALVVVVLGGWTRLNDAGLGCPDWPGCYGTWVLPDDHGELAAAHPDADIDLSKGWIEMIHRYAAGTLGLLVAVLALLAFRARRQRDYPVGLSYVLLLLVIVQALFGMWTVTLKLLPVVVTLHLLGGLATLSLLLRLRQRLQALSRHQVARIPCTATRLILAALLLQLALGGWTSTNYAGWACSDWLFCHRDQPTWYDFAVGLNPVMRIGPNYEGGLLPADARAAIQVSHRLGAGLLLVSLLATRQLWRRPSVRRLLLAYWSMLLVQAMLGVANVIWLLPLGLAVAHHIGAVLLLLLTLQLDFSARLEHEEVKHGYAVAH